MLTVLNTFKVNGKMIEITVLVEKQTKQNGFLLGIASFAINPVSARAILPFVDHILLAGYETAPGGNACGVSMKTAAYCWKVTTDKEGEKVLEQNWPPNAVEQSNCSFSEHSSPGNR